MSIFDGIINDISSLGDSLGGLDVSSLAGSAIKVASGSNQQKSEASSLNAYDMLARSERLSGTNNYQPYPVRGMQASKSEATKAVDSEEYQQAWLRRLDRYISIANSTSFTPKR